MTVWFTDPLTLFRKNDVLNFWPTSSQNPSDRINASTRFILYAACIFYIIKRDPRVFMLAAMVLSVMFIMYKSNIISTNDDPYPSQSGDYNHVDDCQLPTRNNPMANMLVGDSSERPPACYYPTVRNGVKGFLDNTFQYDAGRSKSSMPSVQRNAAARQFISAPLSTLPGAQTDFAEWCYGKKDAPMCKDDSSMCNPDARGVQLEAFAGLDPSGDMRTGMTGGGRGRSGFYSS